VTQILKNIVQRAQGSVDHVGRSRPSHLHGRSVGGGSSGGKEDIRRGTPLLIKWTQREKFGAKKKSVFNGRRRERRGRGRTSLGTYLHRRKDSKSKETSVRYRNM